MKWVLACLVVLVACKGKSDPSPTATGSGGSGSAPVAVVVDAAVQIADAAVAAVAVLDIDSDADDLSKLIFEDRVPQLPAISPDGQWIAELESDGGGPMVPQPFYVSIRRLDNKGKDERLDILDVKMVDDAQAKEESWEPPPPALLKTLRERAAAVTKRLAGFASLDAVEGANSDSESVKIGTFTLAHKETDNEGLEVTLLDGARRLERESVDPYSDNNKEEELRCSFRPVLGDAYTDRAKTKVIVRVQFRWRDDCGQQDPHFIVWQLPPPPDPALVAVVTGQLDADRDLAKLFLPDGSLVNSTTISGPDQFPYILKAGNEIYSGHDDTNVSITLSRDGKSAWASLTTKLGILVKNEGGRDDPWRVSSLLTKAPDGWKIAATMWSEPVANAKANADAKSGKLKPPPAFTVDKGDATLVAAFGKLITDGIDAEAAARGDLVAIGSGPGERTVGGAVFAKGWNAGWKGKATITSSIARVVSTTTGWVAASVELSKGSYKIPFVIFAVFDKTTAGAWSLVHLHFSV